MLKLLMMFLAGFFSGVVPLSAGVDFDGKGGASLLGEIGGMKFELPSVDATKAFWSKAEWTIMVYINSKNNLDEFGLGDINEMEMVGSSDKVNVLVEIGRTADYAAENGGWYGTRRYYVKKDTDTLRVNSPVMADLGQTDMGNYANVIAFGKWAKKAYPAKKYMLIIWNHGSGWSKDDPVPMLKPKGISYDDDTGHNIDTPQMNVILKEIGGVDVYASDACLMQMAEVAYELKGEAKFIVGSEETEAGDGYTYNTFLAPLVANPKADAEAVARLAVDAYADYYKPRGAASTQSALRASALWSLPRYVDNFTSAIMRAGDKALVMKILDEEIYGYADYSNKDLYHFTEHVVAGTKSNDVRSAGKTLMYYLKHAVITHNRTTDYIPPPNKPWLRPESYADSYGLSIYMPGKAPIKSYYELKWAKNSDWAKFLEWLAKPVAPENFSGF